jgi:ABC-type antimicrobial peptide transport system permease subunit
VRPSETNSVKTAAFSRSDPVRKAWAVKKHRHASSLDRTVPVYDIKTMRQRINDATVSVCFNVILLTAFAVISIVLAVVGIYGVMSFAVRQRTTKSAFEWP